MGCKKITYRNFSILKIVHRKKATANFFLRLNGDHLGNIRLSYKDVSTTATPDLEIQEENNYYPFGLKHKGYHTDMNGRDHKYEYQGQESEDALSLGWKSFKWRNHDPSIGRFISIDPLAELYNSNSTYAFGENRVIDGFELEGLEYVNANEARITVLKGGRLHYKMQNMTRLTRNAFKALNSDPKNWTPGTIGRSTQFGEANFTESANNSLPRGLKESITRTAHANNRTKNGKIDRRKTGRTLKGGRYGAKSTGAAKGILIVAAIDFTGRAVKAGTSGYDRFMVAQDRKMLNLAVNDLNKAMKSGMIDEQYLNVNDLSIILNVIFQGDSYGNEELEKVGLDIFKWFNIYKPLHDVQQTTSDNKLQTERKKTSPIIWSKTPTSDD